MALGVAGLLVLVGGCAEERPVDVGRVAPVSVPAIVGDAAPPVAADQAVPGTRPRAKAAPLKGAGSPTAIGPPFPEILVLANRMAGYWAVTSSTAIDIDVGLFSGVRITYDGLQEDRDICLVHERDSTLRATCVAGFTPTADGDIDGDEVTLRWWSGPATVIFRGNLDDEDKIAGAFSGGLAGMSVTGAVPARLRHLPAPPEGEDRPSAALVHAVLGDLRNGVLTTEIYEPAAIKRVRPGTAWPSVKATSHSLAFLGQIHIRWHRKQAETVQDVYAVRSPGNLSLCRIALSERNRVVDFACQDTGP